MEHPTGLSIWQLEMVDDNKYPALWFCLLMDGVGLLSCFTFMAEWVDVCWAPFSAYVFYRSFGGKTGKVGAFVNLLEELLPFADVLPTYTIAYFYQRWQEKRNRIA